MLRFLRITSFVCALVASAFPAPAQQPTQAQANAIRGACRNDYMNHCADVPTGGTEALQCLQQHAGEVSSGCRTALAPLNAPKAPAPAASTGSTPIPPMPPMEQRDAIRLLRVDCGADYRTYCNNVEFGGGRAFSCLREHGAQLAPECRSALLAAARHR